MNANMITKIAGVYQERTSKRRRVAARLSGASLPFLCAAALLWRGDPATAIAQTEPPSGITLSALAGGRSAVIDFQSSGCGHFDHFRLRYEPSPTPRLLVTDLKPRWVRDFQTGKEPEDTSPRPLSVVLISPGQVARFDNLLRFYRRPGKRGGCTTSDTVTVTLYEDEHETAVETFVDDTCQADTLADADPRDLRTLKISDAPALSLRRVFETAERAAKRGLSAIPYIAPPREQTEAYQSVRWKRAEERTQKQARRMAETLPGYAALRREFRIHRLMLGHINMLPYSLHPDLNSLRPRLVDTAWWFDPVVRGRPKYDWNQFLAVHREVERVVGAHVWVAGWKKAGPGRTVEAQVFGLRPNTETDMAFSVVPAWKHARLKGVPHYEVLLRRGDDTWATLYFGKEDRRALIERAIPPKSGDQRAGGHWLDTLPDLFYHPTEKVPEYAVVSPNGTWARNMRAK